ncbi:protein Atg16l2 isoform X2 [Lepisosteus oculatus]|uniref:protein Atg16l2 isoform X2 n=1 Tax=Lepisosteus oculatus TaxID=7918 RepID=UPI00073FB975|nr:PREDICTED: autophagy-related protein 16-2 isoform X2 [Lepisosteus oculatus]
MMADARRAHSAGSAPKRAADSWKRHIARQLKQRDLAQKIMFQDVIRSYMVLLEKFKQKDQITRRLLGSAERCLPDSVSKNSSEMAVVQHEDQVTYLQKIGRELAYEVVDLQKSVRIKDSSLVGQRGRMSELKRRLGAVESECRSLRARVAEVQEGNRALKREYDSLLEQHRRMDETYRREEVRGSELLEDLIKGKELAAESMNSKNERRVQARAATLKKELETAVKKKVNIDIGSGNTQPTKRGALKEEVEEKAEKRPTRSFRMRKRGSSVSSLEEDLCVPVGVCVVARVPAKALHVLDAHELGINAVKFSSSSKLLATGGTDRVIKVWDIKAGRMHSRGTLGGSNEGITSIEFDPTGTKILAASYDNSALFWKLDDCVPKLTLTGHSRKVTAAKFKCSLRQVVTGSADRTVKIWDLHRPACIRTIDVSSYCSDVVCSEYFIVSGHYDKKIRFWDSRASSCTQEVPAQGKVTSLDISLDHRQLLTCSRDESLQVMDLRMNNARMSFRADGFKCGSDSTKAIFSPDGSYVTAGSADGAVYIWNVNSGHLETCLSDMHCSSINAVSWSLSGEFVVSVDKSRRAVLWSDI